MRAFHGFADQATRRLTVLDNAASLQDLAGLHSNRLEALSGDRTGQYSIRSNCSDFVRSLDAYTATVIPAKAGIHRGKGCPPHQL